MIILITLTIMIITITITLTIIIMTIIITSSIIIMIIIRWMLDEGGWLIGVNFHDGAVVASYPWDHYTVMDSDDDYEEELKDCDDVDNDDKPLTQ